MNTWRKCISLILCPCLLAYSLPLYAVPATVEPVAVEITDETMSQIVGSGNLDVTMSDYKLGGTPANAKVVNRSATLIASYEMNLIDVNGVVIQKLTSGTLSPNTALNIQGLPPYGGTNNQRIQARIYWDAFPALEAVDTSWASVSIDSDNDGITDTAERKWGLNPYDPLDAELDNDGDGLTNIAEINVYRTDPNNPDHDNDGINDGNEIANGLNPKNSSDASLDPDRDFITNADEINIYGSDINVANPGLAPDADNDGLNDTLELALGINPNDHYADSVGLDTLELKQVLHAINRMSFGPTSDLIAEVQAKGIGVWMNEQLVPIGLDEDPADPAQIMRDGYAVVNNRDYDLGTIRPMHSIKPLQARMALFWDNHFSTYRGKTETGAEFLEEDLFFVNAFGNFRTLLGISAKSDAMMQYLDLRGSRIPTPNENYARELMELHTFGQTTVDGTYTAADVAALSSILTGWHSGKYTSGVLTEFFVESRYSVRFSAGNVYKPKVRTFRFISSFHDTSEKVFLGQIFPAGGGLDEGDRALDILATHPVTANFICTKLAKYFVSDMPDLDTVNGCVSTFTSSAADPDQIKQVLENLFSSNQFTDLNNFRSKFKDNQEHLFSLGRFFGLSSIGTTQPGAEFINASGFGTATIRVGQGLFDHDEPDGWGDDGDGWITGNVALNRFREANAMIFSTSQKINLVNYFNNLGISTAGDITAHLFLNLLGGHYDIKHMEMAYWALHPGHSTFAITDGDAEIKLKNLVARIVQLPEFSLH